MESALGKQKAQKISKDQVDIFLIRLGPVVRHDFSSVWALYTS